MKRIAGLLPDGFTLTLFAAIIVASVMPARGAAVPALKIVTVGAIALLFFFHGARLSRQALVAGLTHWRLHGLILLVSFALFPLVGVALQLGLDGRLPAELVLGMVFLCLLPSTVQSSIALTAIAGGNVAAAVCSASASNLLGVVLTPALVAVVMQLKGGVSLGAVGAIIGQLLVPFIAGHLVRPLIVDWVERHRRGLGLYDRGTIVLVVYAAFGQAVVNGLWQTVRGGDLVLVLVLSTLVLVLMLATTVTLSRGLGFDRADEITIAFCGSQKSLASGVPIASVLFPAATVGAVVLPVMLYHQIQLMVCAVLARRYGRRGGAVTRSPVPAAPGRERKR